MKVEWARSKRVALLERQLDVVLAEFAQCSERIESIAFMLPETSCSVALSLVEICQRKLHSLSLLLYGQTYHTCFPNTLALCTVLSQLKALEIEGVWPSTLDAVERFPSLTKLNLRADQHPKSFARFLEKCPFVEELRCEVYSDIQRSASVQPMHSSSIRTLSSIRLLDIRTTGRFSGSIYDFNDSLRMPHLHRLDIDYGHPKDCDFREDWPELVRFLQASSPPLESLYLYDCAFSARAITACLRLLRGLKSLRCRVSKQVAKVLNTGRIAGQPELCPELQRMVLDIPILASADVETLATVLEEVVCSRCLSTTGPSTCRRPGLRRLDLPNEFLLRTKFTERFRVSDCVSLGLSIGISCPGEEAY